MSFLPLQNSSKARIRIASVFCLIAFLIRLVFAFQWQDTPYGTTPLLDADGYDKWAWQLAQGHDVHEAYYQSPLYPYLLSCLYRVVGHSYLAASLLNDALDAFTVFTLTWISFGLFGRIAAIGAGCLSTFFEPMIFFTAPLMKEPLELCVMALFLYFSLRAQRSMKGIDFTLCGLFFGLSCVARGNALLLFPVVPLFAFRACGKKSLPKTALFALAAFLAILPFAWHNYVVSDDFVPLTYDGGFNLYIGHSAYANGTNAYPPELSTSPAQEKLAVILEAEKESGHTLHPSEVSSFWFHKAVDYALSHPRREMQLLGLKLFAFWNDADDIDNYDVRFIRAHFASVLSLSFPLFWLMSMGAAFTVGGTAFSFRGNFWRQDFALLFVFTVFYMASLVIFYMTDRYRLPVVLFLIPLASGTPYFAKRWIERKEFGALGVASGAGLLFCLLALWPPLASTDLTAFNWGTLTSIYAQEHENDKSLDAFHRGVSISPTGVGSQAYVAVAGIYEHRGQQAIASQLIQRAVELFPNDGVILYNLGRLQAGQGQLDRALISLQQAQKLAPDFTLIYYARAKIFQKQGDIASAQKAVAEGLTVDPNDARLTDLAAEPFFRTMAVTQ